MNIRPIRYYVAIPDGHLWRVIHFPTRAQRDERVARETCPAGCLTWSNRSAA